MARNLSTAAILQNIFSRLDNQIPKNGGTPTLFQAWNAALEGQQRSQLEVVEIIGKISTLMIKLENQIRTSQYFDDENKHSALTTLGGFQPLLQFDRFHQPASGFKNLCAVTQRGQLGILGHSLVREFPEPALDQTTAEQVLNAANELNELIRRSDIYIDLKVNLLKHLGVLIWWLSNPDILSTQDVFETSGVLSVVAKQLTERGAEETEAKQKQFSDIFEKSINIFWQVSRVLNFIPGDVKAIEDVGRVVANFLK